MADYWCEEDFANEEQMKLFELLRDDKGEDFAACYHCCLKVLNEFHHPEKLPLAGFALRELINKLGWHPSKDSLGNRVGNLENEWKQLTEVGEHNGKKRGDDGPIQRFLEKCEEFFSWKEEERRSRRKQMEEILIESDPGKLPLPSQLVRPRANKLFDIWDYVNTILHHGNKEKNEVQFRKVLEDFEHLLLLNRRPKTFRKQVKFDRIIKEAEKSGNA